jgi:ATPases involved in chromosome partitioning
VDLGFAEDPGYAGNSGYAGNPDFGRDVEPVPAMESLPDPAGQSAMPAPVLLPPRGAAEIAPPPPVGHRAFRDQVLAPPPVMEPEYERETSDSLTTESLLHGKRAGPGRGWRRSVYRASGGLLRFGESAAEMRRRDLINRVRTPVAGGHHRVAVLSLKGGVGKTTTAVGTRRHPGHAAR